MAFVFGKAQRNSKQPSQQQPGPASYMQESKEIEVQNAPFNSSAYKQSVFDAPIQKPGPGSYDAKYHKDLNQPERKSQSSCFHSKVPRFKAKQSSSPKQERLKVRLVGEKEERQRQKQAYQHAVARNKSRLSNVQEQNHQRKIDYVGNNKQFVRIVLANPQNTQMRQSIFLESSVGKKGNGPGSYSSQKRTKPKSVVDWSRSTHQRFHSATTLAPGPGEYQQQPSKKEPQPSAAFAYQGLRSHMDQILYKTNVPLKVKIIEERKLKDRYPGPADYNPQLTHSKSFHYGEANFGSFEDQNIQQQKTKQLEKQPGPGYYFRNTYNSHKDSVKKQRQKIFGKQKAQRQKEDTLESQHWAEMRKQCMRDIEANNNKFYSLQERCTSKQGNFAHAKRFSSEASQEAPGPGHYPRSPRTQSQPKASNAFNSTAHRLTQTAGGQQKTPFYDVERNDLGKRALRMKKNLENLKQIDIEKAPFNSKQPRFNTEGKKSVDTNETPQLGGRVDRQKGRAIVIKKERVQESSVFRSRSQQRWQAPAGQGVGPGEYDHPRSLEKRSFNVEYKYEWANRVRPCQRTRSSLG